MKKAKYVAGLPGVSLCECGDNGVLTAEPIQFNLRLNCPGRYFISDRYLMPIGP